MAGTPVRPRATQGFAIERHRFVRETLGVQPILEVTFELRDIDRAEHAAERGFGRALGSAVCQTPAAQPPQHRGTQSLHPFADRGTALCATDHGAEDRGHERALRVRSTAGAMRANKAVASASVSVIVFTSWWGNQLRDRLVVVLIIHDLGLSPGNSVQR